MAGRRMHPLSVWVSAGKAGVAAFRERLRGPGEIPSGARALGEKATSRPDKSPSGERDLFGAPVERVRRRRPGRPPHVPTDELRDRVRELHQAGKSQPEIAEALALSVPTLTRHYHRELDSLARYSWVTFKGGADARN